MKAEIHNYERVGYVWRGEVAGITQCRIDGIQYWAIIDPVSPNSNMKNITSEAEEILDEEDVEGEFESIYAVKKSRYKVLLT